MDKKLSEKQLNARERYNRRRDEIYEENKRKRKMKASAEYKVEMAVRDLSYQTENDPVAPSCLKRDTSELDQYLGN